MTTIRDNQPAIVVKNLTKEFIIPHKKHNSLKSLFVNFGRKGKVDRRKVLSNINLTVNKGDFFGIVGRNGSGKSTLLKLLAGVYTPTNGEIGIDGSLTPFIELGVGFNPELTGRENVFLNGSLLGFTHKQMENMYDDIVDFAELQDFMDQKLKNYSSGMQVRLAFSIAIRAQSDILLIDEVLAVGDAAFQAKCNKYFEKIKKSNRTIIIVTHDMDAVKRYCNKAIFVENGSIKEAGLPSKVAKRYLLENMSESNVTENVNMNLGNEVKKLNLKLLSKKVLASSDTLKFKIEYILNKNIEIDIGIAILRQGLSLIEQNTKSINLKNDINKKHIINYAIPLNLLNPGEYQIDIAIFEKKDFRLIGFNTDSCRFIVDDGGIKKGGVLALKGEWNK